MTNTWKHFGVMLAVGLLAWAFAYLGKAQGLGFFPNVAAVIVTIDVEYRQWSRSGKQFMVLLKERWLDSFVDIVAGNAGFFLGYNVLLRLFAGGWIV